MSQTDDAGIAGPQVRVRRALDGRVGRDRARPLGHLMLRRAAQDLPPEQLPVRPDGPHAGAGRLGARRRAHDGRPRRPRTRRRHDDDDARAAPARSNDGRHRRRRSHLRRNRSLTRAASLSKRQNLASRAPNSLSLVRRSFSRCVWIHFRARASRQASRRSRSSSRPRSPRWPPACPRERRQTTGPKEREREREAREPPSSLADADAFAQRPFPAYAYVSDLVAPYMDAPVDHGLVTQSPSCARALQPPRTHPPRKEVKISKVRTRDPDPRPGGRPRRSGRGYNLKWLWLTSTWQGWDAKRHVQNPGFNLRACFPASMYPPRRRVVFNKKKRPEQINGCLHDVLHAAS